MVSPNKLQSPIPEVRQQLYTTERKIAGLTESSSTLSSTTKSFEVGRGWGKRGCWNRYIETLLKSFKITGE